MLKFDQLFAHEPPTQYGDCQRTCYACLLEVPPNDVPHFAEQYYTRGLAPLESWNDQRSWLRQNHQYDLVCFHTDVSEASLANIPRGICIAGGKSPRGNYGHAVIWRWHPDGGDLVHDPHPSRAGIVGKPEELLFLVPTGELRDANG